MNLQEKLQAIANHYGMDLQAIKLAEEGAELAAATLKNVGLMIQQENGKAVNPSLKNGLWPWKKRTKKG